MTDLDMLARAIANNATEFTDRTPTLGTLLEEVAEYARAVEGKHEHTPEHELIQIGGIILNMLRLRWEELDLQD